MHNQKRRQTESFALLSDAWLASAPAGAAGALFQYQASAWTAVHFPAIDVRQDYAVCTAANRLLLVMPGGVQEWKVCQCHALMYCPPCHFTHTMFWMNAGQR